MFIFTSFCTMHCMICSVYFPFFFWALYFTLNLKLAVQFPYEYSPFMRMNILWLECSLHFRFEYPLLNIPHDEMYIRIFFITFAHSFLSIWEIEVERDSWNVKLSRAKERYVSDKLQDSRLFTKRTELNENVSWILAFLEIKMWMWKVEENIDFQFWNSQFRSRHYQRKIFDIFSPETNLIDEYVFSWRSYALK